MRAKENNSRKAGQAASDDESATSGAAVRAAFLRHVDEQQLIAGFAVSVTRGAPAAREKPRGRTRR